MSETQEVVETLDLVETQDVVEAQEEVGNDDIDIEQLIMLVEERQMLWDKSVDYKDRNKNREAWREICQVLYPGFDEKSASEKKQLGDSLMKKWRNIRDRWMKQTRKDKDSKKSGAGASKIKKYIYHDQLQFLKKVAHQHATESSINLPPEASQSVSPTEEIGDGEAPPALGSAQPNKQNVTRKRKRNQDEFELKMMKVLDKTYDEEETYFGFFRSMIPTLKTFSSDQFVEFQLGVLGVLKTVKAQGNHQGTSQVPPTTQYQPLYPYHPGSQPPNMYYAQQQPQFPPQQAYTNPYIHPIHPHTSTSNEPYHPRTNQPQTSKEAINHQPTQPLRTPTPQRSTSTPPSSAFSLDFAEESNDWSNY